MSKSKKLISVLLTITLIISASLTIASPALAFTSTDADTAMSAFNNAFYTGSGTSYYFKNDTSGGRSGFWTQAELIELVEDAYDRTGSVSYSTQATYLYNGFVNYYGTDWSSNIYNDDILWICIASLRLYEITGNTAYRTVAKTNFDMVWARAYDTNLGGGLWWTTNNTSKNTCVNCPGAIAAYKLYTALGDSTYLNKANSIFTWVKNTLYNNTTGQVYDNINISGVVDQKDYTYNSGTFIGIANYLNDTINATKALDFAKNSLTVGAPGGILLSERATSDQGGFKGIFWRYACKYVYQRGLDATYTPWFQLNANLGWANRDTVRNLKNENICSVTGSETLNSWYCSSQVSIMQNCTPGGSTPEAVRLYQHVNYGGSCYTLLKGEYGDMTNCGLPNDWLSSLKVPAGWTVKLYQHGNFGGTVWTFTADTSYVGSAANDQTSSLKIQ